MSCSLYEGKGFLRVALATSELGEAHSSFHLPNSLSDLAGALVGFCSDSARRAFSMSSSLFALMADSSSSRKALSPAQLDQAKPPA